MDTNQPHFLLYSESTADARESTGRADQWRFVLESVDDGHRFCVTERESETSGDRLELLAVVRGLEALDQPSRVTLVTKSRYVSRGFRRGIDEWRTNNWRWECFGRMVPVKNADLWQRIDRALRFHQLECRTWRFDMPPMPQRTEVVSTAACAVPGPCDRQTAGRAAAAVTRWFRGVAEPLQNRRTLCGTT